MFCFILAAIEHTIHNTSEHEAVHDTEYFLWLPWSHLWTAEPVALLVVPYLCFVYKYIESICLTLTNAEVGCLVLSYLLAEMLYYRSTSIEQYTRVNRLTICTESMW